MPNHMTTIGFDVHSREDFERLAQYVLLNGERIKSQKGTYIFSNTGNGIEIWLQLNKGNEVIGLNPHYSGSSKIRVKITNEVTSESNSILDGSFHAWADPDDEVDSGSFLFVFDMPNEAVYGEVLVPQILNIQLSAFAHEISVYDSEEEFVNSQDTEIKFAAESFIPSGLFGDEDTPSATAIFTGRVIDKSIITNDHTGNKFYWALVKTLGGEIDVVIDANLINKEITLGGIITGSFWLSAKFDEDPKQKKITIIQRLFGR